jgi:hypothetical protein
MRSPQAITRASLSVHNDYVSGPQGTFAPLGYPAILGLTR